MISSRTSSTNHLKQLESERIVQIADDMLKYGSSGKGIPTDAFTGVVLTLSSEAIWHHLKIKGYLTATGYLTLDAASHDYTLILDEPFSWYVQEIRSVLKTFKTAQIEAVNLNALLQHFYGLNHRYLESKNISLVIEGNNNDCLILGREDELMRCLMNCIKNAEQSLEKVAGEKRIMISVSTVDAKWVGIEIADNGFGIPKENLEKVKEAFFTTKDPAGGKNVGLGLAFVTRIVEGYGGKVEIESEVGVGTRVRICIPSSSANL